MSEGGFKIDFFFASKYSEIKESVDVHFTNYNRKVTCCSNAKTYNQEITETDNISGIKCLLFLAVYN